MNKKISLSRKPAKDSKDRRRITILCVGGSFTEGIGAEFYASYPCQLERLLCEAHFSTAKVVNGGRGGSSSSSVLSTFSNHLQKYQPRLVFLMTGANNFWNLEESSYFILHASEKTVFSKANRFLNRLRPGHIFKTIWVNFIARNNAQEKNSTWQEKIHTACNQKSMFLLHEGQKAQGRGDYAFAMEKYRQALMADPKNYLAAFWLAERYCALGNFRIAREYLWLSVTRCDTWDYFINYVNNVILRLTQSEELELNRLKAYLLEKYDKKKIEKALKFIDVALKFFKEKRVLHNVLTYDLEKMVTLSREKNFTLVFLTYPSSGQAEINDTLRNVAKQNSLLLVDNEEIFRDKGISINNNKFFGVDSLCNGRGYKIIAENVYNAITKNRLLERR